MWAGFPCVRGCVSLALVSLLAPAAVAVPRAHAQAQPQASGLSGAWQAGATTVEVSIESWGKDCGPRPEPMRSAGGGTVQVEQQGPQLVIRARDRVLQSDRCASPNPAVRRVSSARIGNTWTTHCRTDTKDPRQEAATYTLELLSADRLRYRDQSHFDWRLHESTCKATITTTQLLERRGSGAQAPASGGQSAPGGSAISVSPPSTEPACVPGAAAKLSLRPSKVELALGDRVCFEARVADARNCPLPNPKVRFALERGPGIQARLEGRCFHAAERSAEGEGSFRVIATAGGLRDQAEVEVTAEQLPSLIAARVVSGALEGVPDGPAAGAAAPKAAAPAAAPGQSASRVAARAAPEAASSTRRPWLLVLAVLLVLTAVGFVLRRERGARPSSRPATPITPLPTPVPPRSDPAASPQPPLRCPRCGTRFELGNTFCGNDGERLVADG